MQSKGKERPSQIRLGHRQRQIIEYLQEAGGCACATELSYLVTTPHGSPCAQVIYPAMYRLIKRNILHDVDLDSSTALSDAKVALTAREWDALLRQVQEHPRASRFLVLCESSFPYGKENQNEHAIR